MKNLFETPAVELIKFDVEDVVTASSGLTATTGDGDKIPFDDLFQ